MIRTKPPYDIPSFEAAGWDVMRPRWFRPNQVERNRQIVAEREAGHSLAEIGRRHGISKEMVRFVVIKAAIIAERQRRLAP